APLSLSASTAALRGHDRRPYLHSFPTRRSSDLVQLTGQGRRAALRMIRRHRVLELYLTQLLNYDWGRVHQEAERLEHAVSDDLIDRKSTRLNSSHLGISYAVFCLKKKPDTSYRC